ncbi:MAG: V-type ATP synthase subunit I [archaeon]|nr:V-type ATP synthase subunit I [archaeon]
MCKVRVIGLKSAIKQTIDSLEKYGGLEIKQISSNEIKNHSAAGENLEILEKNLVLEAMLNSLESQPVKGKFAYEETKKALNSPETKKTEKRLGEIRAEMEKISAEKDDLKEKNARIKMFTKFGFDFGKTQYESIEIVAGKIQKTKMEGLQSAMQKMRVEYTQKPLNQTEAIMLIAMEKNGNALEEMQKAGFEKLSIPKMDSKPEIELARIEAQEKGLENRENALKKELQKISRENYGKLCAMKEYAQIETEKSRETEKFAASAHTFIMEAYLPEKKYPEFEKFLKAEFGEKVHIEKFSAQHLEKTHEEAPTLLEQPKQFAHFEFMTKFISIPKHNELDPTLIFMLFFPVFYGMIVGDAVYGIISFLLAKVIRDKFPDGILNPIGTLWMWCAVPTIIFGIIFDEYAGFSHEKIFEMLGFHELVLYHGLERMHNIELLMALTILLGIVTVAMGFLFGFINAARHGDKKHMYAKLGWFGITAFGTVFVSILMFNALPQEFFLPSGALLFASLAIVLIFEGIMSAIEIPSVVGNILSFARILAVGLVGVVIAAILNDLAFPSLDKGILLIVFLPLFIAGHVFNAFLAMFEALIQGARLNYVEFYSKFYQGGGKEFTPFRFNRKYTKE